ncbi:uncharacterized protein MYCFIDRAFT_177158 [Pseudocercospora fijiensis CIRAD86]|uniref:Uncharacterized protein n=1 Tax=Pseudocercospora fijiensis (strain CIRAD86) TaxID=383855 RepID=M2ZM90_PSEFD|nr:uncharacterized protein MYCFIDRAFT_177158 [Pseudocercospora fijiensis CIRAD86]EME80184.1 hypothetical protein MYCFIDRAFT_177158 [Pseudocercospora fijiensis CIRAD86]
MDSCELAGAAAAERLSSALSTLREASIRLYISARKKCMPYLGVEARRDEGTSAGSLYSFTAGPAYKEQSHSDFMLGADRGGLIVVFRRADASSYSAPSPLGSYVGSLRPWIPRVELSISR